MKDSNSPLYAQEYYLFTIVGIPVVDGKPLYHATETHQRLKTYKIPRWQWDLPQTGRRLQWIQARFEYMNYNMKIQVFSNFCNETGQDASLLRSIAATKGQITKLKKAIKWYVEDFQPTLLIQDVREDDYYKRGKAKLYQQEIKLQKLLDRQAQQDLEKRVVTEAREKKQLQEKKPRPVKAKKRPLRKGQRILVKDHASGQEIFVTVIDAWENFLSAKTKDGFEMDLNQRDVLARTSKPAQQWIELRDYWLELDRILAGCLWFEKPGIEKQLREIEDKEAALQPKISRGQFARFIEYEYEECSYEEFTAL